MVARNRPVTFGKYTLLERIAVGGMAEVFLAVQTGLEGFEKRLAIKLWSGWPTFPQVFVRGELIGGEDLTKAAIASVALQGNGVADGSRSPA